MNRLTTLGVALVVASLVFAGTVAAAGGLAVRTDASETVQATDGTAVRADGGWHGPFNGTANETRHAPGDRLQDRYNLTDEQTDELQTLVADLRDDGATADEVRTAVNEKLTEFGVDEADLLPDPALRVTERLDLTDDQTAELEALVADLRDDGATADEVRTAVDEKLTEFGVDASALACGGGDGARHHASGPRGFGPRGN
ncbi:uncharacterized protein HfgLR_12130 [Haloferax gibbonsii]|uniref:Uncharacterized protein n=1 Tax=Haloferax gibbonsii TaxID=35746 RepID=A0A871BIR8_HALGI|nr:hypothetical protein [Haloferax gibbonsii]QOS12563.1 uncharacterized protein HfgLR_12130 [Haloferax gibbonsii]